MTDEIEALIEDLRLNHEYCPKEGILRAADVIEQLSQHPWVGLTEDEAIELLPAGDWEIESTLGFAHAIEVKLRDKNT